MDKIVLASCLSAAGLRGAKNAGLRAPLRIGFLHVPFDKRGDG
jgi:hypothetical protein